MADNAPLLDEVQIKRHLRRLKPDWSLLGNLLERQVEVEDFAAALELADRTGRLAEKHDHHPELTVAWGKLTIQLTTHSAGGLTAKDFDLARAIDRLA